MNSIGIYTNQQFNEFKTELFILIKLLTYHKKHIYIQQPVFNFLKENDSIGLNWKYIHSYNSLEKENLLFQIIITIGGDGTILESIHQLYPNLHLPVLGINSGRLGFLANINISEIEKAIYHLLNKNYNIDNRTMVELVDHDLFDNKNFALNEFTIHKLDTSSMINIELYINQLHVNTYWADGLIISTPTGSTAYSLSAGGPIVHPDTKNLIITPIAAHNLNIRPLIVSDNVSIQLKVSGRAEYCMISMDYLSKAVPINSKFTINKSNIEAKFLNIQGYNYFNTLKNKLLWGADKRN
ncbi:MAG: NAD kinase [Bacteroidales bacterium]|nr:NAD kinase [Bacteroidales bacterium]